MKMEFIKDKIYDNFIYKHQLILKFNSINRDITDIEKTYYNIVSNLKRKDIRFIFYHFSIECFHTYKNIKSFEHNKDINILYKNNIKNIEKLYNILFSLNLTQDEIEDIWLFYRSKYKIRHDMYNKIFIEQHTEHRDNKNYINYTGGGGSNKIRYPRKCRKTAWKRFYKIFPHLNPENEKNNENNG